MTLLLLLNSEAVKKIAQVWTVVYCKIIIGAWRFVVQDAKKTKDYFEVKRVQFRTAQQPINPFL